VEDNGDGHQRVARHRRQSPGRRPARRRDREGPLRQIVRSPARFAGASAIANNYYAQPLLPLIRDALGLSTGVAGLIVTLGQLGYALGLLLLVPLGGIVQRRRLVLVMVGGSALPAGSRPTCSSEPPRPESAPSRSVAPP
jgi:hypothetical protein